ncbi:MAG: hypothetical protein PHV85_00995, partial [Desulfovibrionaceae bacterium]|nr:hypothetical protein [Desulfovibrionaceae bacterium]
MLQTTIAKTVRCTG